MEFKTLNKVDGGESARAQQHHQRSRVLCTYISKALCMLGIYGKGVIEGDSFTVNSHPNLQAPVVLLLLKQRLYIYMYIIHLFLASNIKCKTWLLVQLGYQVKQYSVQIHQLVQHLYSHVEASASCQGPQLHVMPSHIYTCQLRCAEQRCIYLLHCILAQEKKR